MFFFLDALAANSILSTCWDSYESRTISAARRNGKLEVRSDKILLIRAKHVMPSLRQNRSITLSGFHFGKFDLSQSRTISGRRNGIHCVRVVTH